MNFQINWDNPVTWVIAYSILLVIVLIAYRINLYYKRKGEKD